MHHGAALPMLLLATAGWQPVPPLARRHALQRVAQISIRAAADDPAALSGSILPDSREKEPDVEVDPRHLTQWIKSTRNVRDLLALHAEHKESFNHIHLSAAWIALSRHSAARSRASSSKSGYVRFRPMPKQLHQELMPLMRQSASMALAGELAGRELANVMYGVARARIPDGPQRRALLDVLARAAASRMRELKPQELSNSAWAYATAGHRAPELFDALAEVSAARLTRPSLDSELHDFSPQELSNIAWAFASAGHAHPKLFDALASASLDSIRHFNPQNLANTAWAFATARHSSPRLLDALAIASQQQIDRFNSQNIANVVWAYATAGHAAPELFNAVTTEVRERKRGDFKPQELSNMAWAYATAGHISPALFEALAETAAVRGVEDFKPQGVARTAWSFAFAGQRAPQLFDALAAVGTGQASDFHPQNIANTAWAFAMQRHPSPKFFDALGEAAVPSLRAGEFHPLELANLAWAFAMARGREGVGGGGGPNTRLFDALAEASLDRVQEFEPQQVGMLSHAYATAGHSAPALFDALGRISLFQAQWFTPRALASTAWSYAEMGIRSPFLFSALGEAAAGRCAARQAGDPLSGFEPTDVACLAWAFAAADHADGPESALFNEGFVQRCEELFGGGESGDEAGAVVSGEGGGGGGGGGGGPRAKREGRHKDDEWEEEEQQSEGVLHLCQLHQWSLWHRECGRLHSPLSSALSKRCRTTFAAVSAAARPSAGQRHVVAALREMGLMPSERVPLPSGYCVDIVVDYRGYRCGILVDTPDGFITKNPSEARRGSATLPLGKTLFDDRSPSRVRKAEAKAQMFSHGGGGGGGGDVDGDGDVLVNLPVEPDYGSMFRPRGGTALRKRQLAQLEELDLLISVPFWEWKKLLAGNKYAKAAGGQQDLAYLQRWLTRALDSRVDSAGPAPQAAAAVAVKAPVSTASVDTGERASAGSSAAPEAKDAAAPITWNEFRVAHKGKGLSMAQLSEMFREHKSGSS